MDTIVFLGMAAGPVLIIAALLLVADFFRKISTASA